MSREICSIILALACALASCFGTGCSGSAVAGRSCAAGDSLLRRGDSLLQCGFASVDTGRLSSAMRCYAESEALLEGCGDRGRMGDLYRSVAEAYLSALNDYGRAAVFADMAASEYIAAGDTLSYAECRLMRCRALMYAGDVMRADASYNGLMHAVSLTDSMFRAAAGLTGVRLSLLHGDRSGARVLLGETLPLLPSDGRLLADAADLCLQTGDASGAGLVLSRYESVVPESDRSGEYYRLLSSVLSSEGRHGRALDEYLHYMKKGGWEDASALWSMANFAFEDYAREISEQRSRRAVNVLWLLGCAALLCLSVMLFVLMRLRHVNRVMDRERQLLESRIASSEDGIDRCKSALVRKAEDDRQSMSALRRNMSLLYKYVSLAMSSVDEDVFRHCISRVEEKGGGYERVLTELFELSAPSFVGWLRSNGLSGREVDICCMYAAGLRGKDVQGLTGGSRHYHEAMDIRRKLKVNDQKLPLGTYLKSQLSKEEGHRMDAGYVTRILSSFLLFIVLSFGCVPSRYGDELEYAREKLRTCPDSSLACLDGIDASRLRSGRERAEYALLYSMSLDKCRIDITDDSLINIAVTYYSRHGSADDRLKSYYYRARIRENAGDMESAMEDLVIAGSYADDASDEYAKGLLYNRMGGIYFQTFDIRSGEHFMKASSAYLKAGDTVLAVKAMLNASSTYSISRNDSLRSELIARASELERYIPASSMWAYYEAKIDECDPESQSDEIRQMLESYLDACISSASSINWFWLANGYFRIKDYGMMWRCLNIYRNVNVGSSYDPIYDVYVARYKLAMGDSAGALASYRSYGESATSDWHSESSRDTRYLQSRFDDERRLSMLDTAVVAAAILCVILLVLLLASVLVYRRKVRERASLQAVVEQCSRSLSQLEDELARLSSTLSQPTETDLVARSMSGNMSMLAGIIVQSIIGRSGLRDSIRQSVSDKDAFTRLVFESYEVLYPDFVSHLRSAGLTPDEELVCLLNVSGMKVADIARYLGLKCCYVKSSEIRRKLNVGSDVPNLRLYLRSLAGIDGY